MAAQTNNIGHGFKKIRADTPFAAPANPTLLYIARKKRACTYFRTVQLILFAWNFFFFFFFPCECLDSSTLLTTRIQMRNTSWIPANDQRAWRSCQLRRYSRANNFLEPAIMWSSRVGISATTFFANCAMLARSIEHKTTILGCCLPLKSSLFVLGRLFWRRYRRRVAPLFSIATFASRGGYESGIAKNCVGFVCFVSFWHDVQFGRACRPPGACQEREKRFPSAAEQDRKERSFSPGDGGSCETVGRILCARHSADFGFFAFISRVLLRVADAHSLLYSLHLTATAPQCFSPFSFWIEHKHSLNLLQPRPVFSLVTSRDHQV